MRLLERDDVGKIRLTEDLLNGNIPPYAILSHTWGGEEVVFAELKDGTGESKAGYAKIKFCGDQAHHDGLKHFWVDTCCIDKSNNTELQEAINSMFRWYRHAAKCYVYLTDVSTRTPDGQSSWEPAFQGSRWFTRGWTLQELIAPKSVEFFSNEGARLGDKQTLEKHIHNVTGVPVEVLRGGPLSDVSVSDRMAWIEKRNTTREEDKAYSLLGIFNIYMPLIYGEGEKSAFRRLREEIGKVSKNEHTYDEAEVRCLADLRSTDPREDKSRIEATKGGLLADSYLWILGNNEFQRWRNEDNRLLWIKGDPGKGKTMLLCGIINELKSACEPSLTSFFLCQAADASINSASAVLRGLIYLLVDQQPSVISHVQKKYDLAGNPLFRDTNAWVALSEIFTGILEDPSLPRTYLIIDALDECIIERGLLLNLVVRELPKHSNVKWIISSRNWPDIERDLKEAIWKARLCLELNETSVLEAVTTYIKFKV